MAAVVLGLVIAFAFGSGDFVGGRASVSVPAVAVLAVAQACSVVGAFGVALVVSADVAPRDLVFGAAAGALNVLGLGLLYQALARHAAGVVAPITAVVGAVVPVAWGFAQGERPSAWVIGGIVIAIAAGGLIAREPGEQVVAGLARGATHAALSGAALGSSLVLFSETSEDSGQWPVLAARLAALTAVAVVAVTIARRSALRLPTGHARTLAIAAGVLDVAATSLLLVAIRRDLLVVVAPIVSLAPAFTVVLAWLVLGERLHPVQRVGFVLALGGLVLVAAG